MNTVKTMPRKTKKSIDTKIIPNAEIGISVIIAHYNQIDLLNNCLNSLFQSNYINFEVIVIDDCSPTPIDYLKDVFDIKLIQLDKNKGSGFARNLGVKNATKDVVCFIDADTEMPKNIFYRINMAINLEGNDGVCGIVHEKALNKGIVSDWISFETNYILKNSGLKISQFFACVCGAIKKDVYLNNGGMYHRYIDDIEFSSRLPESVNIKLDKEFIFKHCYSNFFTAMKKYFIRSYYYLQLENRNPSPWIPKMRKINTFVVFSSFLTIPMMLINQKLLAIPLGLFFCFLTLSASFFIKAILARGIPTLFISIILRYVFTLSAATGGVIGAVKSRFDDIIYKLIRFSGPLRVFIRSNKPTYIILYVTSKCNSRCSYCFQLPILNNPIRVKGELSLIEYIRLAKSLGPMEHITLGGGEPFLRSDLPEIAIAFYNYTGVRNISIPTNGSRPSLFKTQLEKILLNCPKATIKISLSVDGIGEEHDVLRGLSGNYERLIASDAVLLELSQKYSNLYYSINTVFNARNQHRIIDIINENKKRFNHELQVSTYVRGDVDDEYNSRDVDINRYYDLVDYLENAHTLKNGVQKHKYKLELLLQGLQIESRKAITHIFKKKEGKYYCRAGRNMLVIDDLGNVHPCEILPENYTFNNIRDFDYDIEKLMGQNRVKNIQSRIKNEKCYCSWECAHLNSIPFSIKGSLNMFKHAYNYWKRRKVLLKAHGKELSFDEYINIRNSENKNGGISNFFLDEPIHPMTLEGKEGNPFKYEDLEQYS